MRIVSHVSHLTNVPYLPKYGTKAHTQKKNLSFTIVKYRKHRRGLLFMKYYINNIELIYFWVTSYIWISNQDLNGSYHNPCHTGGVYFLLFGRIYICRSVGKKRFGYLYPTSWPNEKRQRTEMWYTHSHI